jgi:hypothetical protein
MRKYTVLNVFPKHFLKDEIDRLRIRQHDLAYSLEISQSSLSKMLCGIVPMPTEIETQIQGLLRAISRQQFIAKRKKIVRNTVKEAQGGISQ